MAAFNWTDGRLEGGKMGTEGQKVGSCCIPPSLLPRIPDSFQSSNSLNRLLLICFPSSILPVEIFPTSVLPSLVSQPAMAADSD